MYPYEAAKERPLVVLFCYDRFDLLRMALPRVINATRRIGGYLWAIDDGSNDDRVPRSLHEHYEKGHIDWVTFGKTNRCGDFVGQHGARRLVMIRWLYRKNVPLVFLIEADMLIHDSVLETMLEAACSIGEARLPVSAISGTQGNPTIFSARKETLGKFQLLFFGPYLAQGIVLLPLSQVDIVEKALPMKGGPRFSLNQYVARAVDAGLETCHIFGLPTQHLGIGIAAGTKVKEESLTFVNWTDETRTQMVEVPGFEMDRFMLHVNDTIWTLQAFSFQDAAHLTIHEPKNVSHWFGECVDRWK